MIKNNAAIVKALCLHLTEKNAIIILVSYGQIHFRWYESLCCQLKLVWVLTIFNEGLTWHLSQSTKRPAIDFSSIAKSGLNPFMELTSTLNEMRVQFCVCFLFIKEPYWNSMLNKIIKTNEYLYTCIFIKKMKIYKGVSWKWLNKRWEEHFITNMTSLFWWTGELGPLKCVLCYELISQIEFNSKNFSLTNVKYHSIKYLKYITFPTLG